MEPEQEQDRGSSSKVYYVDFRKKQPDKFDNNNNYSSKDLVSPSENSGSGVLVEGFIKNSLPNFPVYCIRPKVFKAAVEFFTKNFRNLKNNCRILYSVKSNPDSKVLQCLFDSGIKNFDVASISEVRMINELFGANAKMYFMHPIKSRETLKEAYFDFGIRDYSLDSLDELHKILQVTNDAKDLNLHIRLSIPNSHSAIDLSGKFGVLPSESVTLLRKARSVAKKLGICFHVGSQCMDPVEYRNAITITKEVIENSKITCDVIDIGGGFPSVYPGMTPPNLRSYFDEIFDSFNQLNLSPDCEIWCEPGRALVAEGASLVVRVEGRKNNMLYINDGTYGGLFDAGFPAFIYPTKAIRIAKDSASKNLAKNELSKNKVAFGFYGPTCDSMDVMKGPFYLPENIAEGDYIEIGQLGAYSRSIRTDFNGFSKNIQIEVEDLPLETMYFQPEIDKEKSSNEQQ